jgi:hypothetical protein
MSVEKSRSEFFQLLTEESSHSSLWMAVCLFIPPEWLHELEISSSAKGLVIAYGRKILSVTGKGFFARVGWSSYCSIVRDDKLIMEEQLENEIVHLQSEEGYCRLWRYAVTEIGDRNPLEVFSELMSQAHEKARDEGKG